MMTTYSVQFTLPVDNPEKNVRITRAQGNCVFDVPINHPDAHNFGFKDLIAAAELSGLLGLPTDLNNTVVSYQNMISKAKRKAAREDVPERKA